VLLRPVRKGEAPRAGKELLKPLRQVIESINQTLKAQLDLEGHGGRTEDGILAERTPMPTALPRACEAAATPSPRRGPVSTLLTPPPDPGPAPVTPRRTRVTIREAPRFAIRRPGIRIGTYRIHVLDVIALILGIAVILAICWPH
jgi:hypothetical protein